MSPLQYIVMLKSFTAFMQENIRMHNAMTAALGQYLKFVSINDS